MSIEAMKQALEALKIATFGDHWGIGTNAINTLRQAIAEAENASAVAWLVERAMCEPLIQMCKPKDGNYLSCEPLYTHPPARKPLTDDEIRNLWDGHTVLAFGKIGINPIMFVRAIERAHGIGDV
jgi:hypothetical protein